MSTTKIHASRSRAAIDCLRATVSIATAKSLLELSPKQQHRFRRNTAKWLDECFFKIVTEFEVQNFIECGAHEASASSRFMRSGGGRALAIEANPSTFNLKTKSVENDGAKTINCGVGIERGTQEFFVPKNDELAGNASFLKKTGEEYNSIMVEVRTVDDLHREFLSDDKSIALWIDVEGSAFEVLKGCDSLLKRENCQVLKMEVEAKAFWKSQSLVWNVNDFLTSLGYVPVLRDMEYVGQYNLIYVRAGLAENIEEILIDCWQGLALLKLSENRRYGRLRSYASNFKNGLINSNSRTLTFVTHRIAANLLGEAPALALLVVESECSVYPRALDQPSSGASPHPCPTRGTAPHRPPSPAIASRSSSRPDVSGRSSVSLKAYNSKA